MKKVFSLILAVVMVASLASVAFAATIDENDFITSDKAKNVAGATGYENSLMMIKNRQLTNSDMPLIFGKEYYLPIYASNADALGSSIIFERTRYATSAKQIGSLKVTAEWKEGGEYVESVGIKPVYVENDGIKRNVYTIYVKTTGASSDSENIVGTIIVAGTPGAGDGKLKEKVETKIAFDQTISNEVVEPEAEGSTDVGTKYNYNNGTLKLSANTKTMKNVKFVLGDFSEVEFDGDVVATLDSAADKKLTISYNTNDVADVVAANPDAALMFYSIECNFKESAEVTIEPIDPEGTNYLYQVLSSGATKDLTSAYSVDDEQFILNQRKLTGTYIVSDMPLVF